MSIRVPSGPHSVTDANGEHLFTVTVVRAFDADRPAA